MEIIDLKDSQCVWAPLDSTAGPETLYIGQLVKSGGDGVLPVAPASGAADTSNKQVIYGLVVGTSDRRPTYNSTYHTHSIASVTTQAALEARENMNINGVWVKGELQPMVRVALIDPTTKIRARLYNSTFGTAPTLLTVTTGSADGLGFTSNACDFTPVADYCTTYCRTGANAGSYRISDDTSTTVTTNDIPFKNDIAVGDTFVRVPLRTNGYSRVQLDSEAIFFDISATPGTNYFAINVISLNLEVAGREYVDFTFAIPHFDAFRA